MKIDLPLKLLSTYLLIFFIAGCGGGVEGTGGLSTASVDGSKKLTDLSDEERSAVCADIRDRAHSAFAGAASCEANAVSELISATSYLVGLPNPEQCSFAQTPEEYQQLCEQRSELCKSLSELPNEDICRNDYLGDSCILYNPTFKNNCKTSTVTQFVQCISDVLSAAEKRNKNYTCESAYQVANDIANGVSNEIDNFFPESCWALSDDCMNEGSGTGLGISYSQCNVVLHLPTPPFIEQLLYPEAYNVRQDIWRSSLLPFYFGPNMELSREENQLRLYSSTLCPTFFNYLSYLLEVPPRNYYSYEY